MHNRLEGHDSRDPSMERVIRCKVPAGQPKENVVAASKQPKDRHVCDCKYTGSIGHDAKDLGRCVLPIAKNNDQYSVLNPSLFVRIAAWTYYR